MKSNIWLAIVISALLLFVVLIWQMNRHHQNQFVENITIQINNPEQKIYFDEADIQQLLLQYHGNLLTRRIKELNLLEIYDSLKKNPWFNHIQVYLDNKILHIHITVRHPIARIFPTNKSSYFIDTEGYVLPHPSKPVRHVLVVTGKNLPAYNPSATCTLLDSVDFDSLQKVPLLNKIYTLAYKIHADSLLKEAINQVNVTSTNQFELITYLSEHQYLLGDLDNIDMKLFNVASFLKYGYPQIDASKYKTFDFQYINQVVATKKIEQNE